MSALQQPSHPTVAPPALEIASNKEQILLDAELLARKLQLHTQRIFPPVAKKAIRRLTSGRRATRHSAALSDPAR